MKWISILAAVAHARKYSLVMEVARHGARSPSIIYDLASDPQTNF
jgi:hypothetical protein